MVLNVTLSGMTMMQSLYSEGQNLNNGLMSKQISTHLKEEVDINMDMYMVGFKVN